MSIAELNGAKQLVKDDPSLYPTVIESLLSIANRPEASLRLWCALFFMDAVTSLELADSVKCDLGIKILPQLATLVGDRDSQVLKITLGVVAHIYPMLFEKVCKNPNLSQSFELMSDIKRRSLLLWDETQHVGVKAACIKLAQIIVQTQSKAEPGSPEPNLSMVMPNNPYLDPVILLAEAQGLLDRLVGYFAEPNFQPGVFSASVNATLVLAKSRPKMAPKIINSICNIKLEQKSGLDSYVATRYVDKTLQLNLKATARELPHLASQINRFVSAVSEYASSSILRKRAMTRVNEDSSKRLKLAQNDWPTVTTTTLGDGTFPLAQLFKLVDDNNVLAQFNARDLPMDVAVKIALSGIKNANATLLNNCVNVITKRTVGTEILTEVPPEEQTAGSVEPTIEAAAEHQQEEQEQVLTLDMPSSDETTKHTTDLLNRLVKAGSQAPETVHSHELERTISWSKESWIYLVSRIATRAVDKNSPVAKRVREFLYKYVMTDFRKHLDLIVIWLSEEWYAENVLATLEDGAESIYFELLAKVIDQVLPRMEVNDSKMFIRLLSDVPALNPDIIFKLQSVCQDPDRSVLGVRALKFLIMLKPPIKEACLDLIVKLNKEGIDGMEKILKQFRPQALE